MPKVLHIIARVNRGGTANFLGLLLPSLNDSGWNTILLTGNVQGYETEDSTVENLVIHRCLNLYRKVSFLKDIRARQEIKQYIKDFNPDLVQSHTFKAGLLLRTIRVKMPIIHTFHGHIFDDPEFSKVTRRLSILIERILAHRTTAFVSTGVAIKEDLISRRIGKPSQHYAIQPPILKIERIPKPRAFANLSLEITHQPVVVWAARVEKIKNPEGFAHLARENPDFQFLMFGEGSLVNEIEKLKLNNLKLMGWHARSDVFSIADFFVSTSFGEGLSNSLGEAAAFGLHILATDVGGNREILSEYRSKVLSGTSHSDLQEGFLKLQALKMKNIDFSHAQKVSLDQFLSRHIEIYRELLIDS